MAHYTEPQNVSNLGEIFTYAQQTSNGVYGIGIAIALYFITFLYLKLRQNDTVDSFAVSGFVTSIGCGLLFLLGKKLGIDLITDAQLFIIFVASILPIVWAYFQRE